jgi:hypothetical protein
MSIANDKTVFDSRVFECQSDFGINNFLGKMSIKNLCIRNCVSAYRSRLSSFGLCCCSVLVLSSCVETLDLPDIDFLNSNKSTHWEASASSTADRLSPVRVMHKNVKSEVLLEEEGVWNLVEQSKSYDPAAAHMAARQKVDTSRRNNDTTLSAHFKPDAVSGKDGKLRVLRLDTGKQADDVYKDIEVSESSFVKPASTVAGDEELKEIASVFGQHGSVVLHNVVPPRKPVRAQEGRDINDVVQASVRDVVSPPELPKGKRGAENASQASTGVSNAGVSLLDDGVPLPERKPAVPSGFGVIEKGSISAGTSVVSAIRAGVHDGDVRLVIETKKAPRYKVAIDHLRNVLRVRLDGAELNVEPQGTLSKSNALFGTYIAKKRSDGSVLLEVRLKKKSQITDTMILRPSVSANHRIVIDMKK